MGWWILFGLIALGLCIYWLWEGEYGWVGMFFATIGMQIAAFVLAVIPILICGAIMADNIPISETRETISIYALADNRSTSGNFFLGIGSVDDDVKYYYVEQTELGKHVSSVPADNAYITESDTPTLTTVGYHWANSGWNWLGVCLIDNNYIFAVPAGSVTEDYTVDLQ